MDKIKLFYGIPFYAEITRKTPFLPNSKKEECAVAKVVDSKISCLQVVTPPLSLPGCTSLRKLFNLNKCFHIFKMTKIMPIKLAVKIIWIIAQKFLTQSLALTKKNCSICWLYINLEITCFKCLFRIYHYLESIRRFTSSCL